MTEWLLIGLLCAAMNFNVRALVQTILQLFLLDCQPATATKHYPGATFGKGPRVGVLSDGYRWILVKLTDHKLFVSPVFAAHTWSDMVEILGMLVHSLTNGRGLPAAIPILLPPPSEPATARTASGTPLPVASSSSSAQQLAAVAADVMLAANQPEQHHPAPAQPDAVIAGEAEATVDYRMALLDGADADFVLPAPTTSAQHTSSSAVTAGPIAVRADRQPLAEIHASTTQRMQLDDDHTDMPPSLPLKTNTQPSR